MICDRRAYGPKIPLRNLKTSFRALAVEMWLRGESFDTDRKAFDSR